MFQTFLSAVNGVCGMGRNADRPRLFCAPWTIAAQPRPNSQQQNTSTKLSSLSVYYGAFLIRSGQGMLIDTPLCATLYSMIILLTFSDDPVEMMKISSDNARMLYLKKVVAIEFFTRRLCCGKLVVLCACISRINELLGLDSHEVRCFFHLKMPKPSVGSFYDQLYMFYHFCLFSLTVVFFAVSSAIAET